MAPWLLLLMSKVPFLGVFGARFFCAAYKGQGGGQQADKKTDGPKFDRKNFFVLVVLRFFSRARSSIWVLLVAGGLGVLPWPETGER